VRKPLALAVVLPLALAPMVATPAQAQSVVKQKKLERNIKQGFAARGYKVSVKCPKNVTWVKGKTFSCTVSDGGSKGTVRVTLKSNATVGKLKWKLA
jgi:uncharacterized lipoprotein YajG